MIGDSPEHDVAGAKAMGLRTLLVRTGIHRHMTEEQLLRFCEEHNGAPDFLVATFEWWLSINRRSRKSGEMVFQMLVWRRTQKRTFHNRWFGDSPTTSLRPGCRAAWTSARRHHWSRRHHWCRSDDPPTLCTSSRSFSCVEIACRQSWCWTSDALDCDRQWLRKNESERAVEVGVQNRLQAPPRHLNSLNWKRWQSWKGIQPGCRNDFNGCRNEIENSC